MKKSKSIFLLIILFVSSAVVAQNNETESLDSGSINGQFDYMINKSNRYMDYKVIKRSWLDKFNSNVSDSLNKLRQEIVGMQSVASDQLNQIEALRTELKIVNDNLTALQIEKDSIELLGLQIEKKTYLNFMWSLTGVLIITLLIFIYKFKRSNLITLESKKTLSEIREEYDNHRKRALEKEQILARELQNELNKTKRF